MAELKTLDVFDKFDEMDGRSNMDITNVLLSDLHSRKDHPYKVLDDAAMDELVESIRQSGVINPGIARPCATGGYELLSGYRRQHASAIAGLPTMPVLIRDVDDLEARSIMIHSNKQRPDLLPSEKAFSYKMELEVVKERVERGGPLVHHVDRKKSRDILGDEIGENGKQISRYIRLTELIPALLEKVDKKIIAFRPAVELSYLKPEEQEILNKTEAKPSLKQAEELKKLSQEGNLTEEIIQSVLTADNKEKDKPAYPKFKRYFPKGYTTDQMDDIIVSLLKSWAKENKSKNVEQQG